MTSRTIFLAAVAGLLALGCGEGVTAPRTPDGTYGLRTTRNVVVAGSWIIVRLENRTGATIHEDHCFGSIEGFEYLGTWNGSYGSARVCNRMLPGPFPAPIAIPPGGVHYDTLTVPEQAYSGRWRAWLLVIDSAGVPDTLYSNEFRVQGSWRP